MKLSEMDYMSVIIEGALTGLSYEASTTAGTLQRYFAKFTTSMHYRSGREVRVEISKHQYDALQEVSRVRCRFEWRGRDMMVWHNNGELLCSTTDTPERQR